MFFPSKTNNKYQCKPIKNNKNIENIYKHIQAIEDTEIPCIPYSATIPWNYTWGYDGYPGWFASRIWSHIRLCRNNVFFMTGPKMRDLAVIPPAFESEFRSASLVHLNHRLFL